MKYEQSIADVTVCRDMRTQFEVMYLDGDFRCSGPWINAEVITKAVHPRPMKMAYMFLSLPFGIDWPRTLTEALKYKT